MMMALREVGYVGKTPEAKNKKQKTVFIRRRRNNKQTATCSSTRKNCSLRTNL